MFAVTYILRGGKPAYSVRDFLCPYITAILQLVILCGALMRPLPLRCKSTGHASCSFLSRYNKLIFSEMTYKKRNCLDGCTASNSYTSSHDTGSPLFSEALAMIQKKFDIEKNAKNKVYAFILSRGLLNEFKEFSKYYSSDNPHSDCLDLIRLYRSDND